MEPLDTGKLFAANSARYFDEWKEFLRFPSISADPAHDQDCVDCANWLVKHLGKAGLSARLLPTPYKPVVFAERNGKSGKPTVLVYGHYDVQPVDPVAEWHSPPFEPTMREGRMYARGASDNKGQVLAILKAMETLITLNRLDCTIRIVIEGEEEYRSRGISESLDNWRDLLKADILMVADTNMARIDLPAIIMGLRGIVNMEMTLTGPRHDLHSGMHGGMAPNPATEMARLVATLHNPDGSIAVEGLYDGVRDPTAREKKLANSIQFNADTYMTQTGVPPVAGEKRFTPVERTAFRPSIDINGIHSGYGGPGGKTIIPSRATAKLSVRLVASQDPAFCLECVVRHLEKHTPTGLNLAITEKSISGPGLQLDLDSPLAKKAAGVLNKVFGKDPAFMWEGASIPVVAALAKATGAEPLLVGFGLNEDRIHAPNESFSIEQFRMGYAYNLTMLSTL